MCDIVNHIVNTVCATYACQVHPSTSYAPLTTTNHLSLFPSLPLSVVLVNTRQIVRRRELTKTIVENPHMVIPLSHQESSPFTASTASATVLKLCADASHLKSPSPSSRHAFVYDNACKLYVYYLNREPALYKDTCFFVDRFHWKGHVGCSRGYSLDSYSSINTKQIYSQVNEQANSGLQRIKPQLAYMKPDNLAFTISLFLSIINIDKIKSLDISQLNY